MLRRRLYSAVMAVFVILAAVSCTGGGEDVLGYQKDISRAVVKWSYGVSEYTATVELEGDIPKDPELRRTSAVIIQSPEDISGLTVRYDGDTAVASVGKVNLDLPENTGKELYLIVRLFSMYPEELAKNDPSSATFRTNIDGYETVFEVKYNDGLPISADITWDTGEIKVTEIAVEN